MHTDGKFYLGVDGGGTQTRAVLAGLDGRVHGVGNAGSANRNHYARAQVRENLRAALQGALSALPAGGRLSALFLGLGGISTEADRRDILGVVREIEDIGCDVRVAVDNDTVVGLTGGLAGRPGIALVAGTGSACLGINAHGERWLCGGWGATADDIGSAPWIGLRALQESVRALDGRAAPTALVGIVQDFLQLTEWRELTNRLHNDGMTRAELGALAPSVVRASAAGDGAAQAILRGAVAGLTEMVRAVTERLFTAQNCDLVLVGGLALSGPPYQTMLAEGIRRSCPLVTLRDPELTPVQGAVLEAMRLDGSRWTAHTLQNLGAWEQDRARDPRVPCTQ